MKACLNQLTFAFDLDNTLVETDYANNLSYIHAVNEVLNVDLQWDFKSRFSREKLRLLFPNLSQQQYDNIIMLKNSQFNAYLSDTTLNSNLVKILSMLYSKGHNTILLTNSHKKRALSICNHYNISHFFNEKYFAEDITKTKYEVLKRNGYDMNSVILFENEEEGTKEAVSNGLLAKNIICVKFNKQ